MPRPFRPSSVSRWFGVLALLAGLSSVSVAQAQKSKPLFSSDVITGKTPGHAVDVDVDIKGAKQLALVVTDGGDGYSCDWADWAEPRLVGPKGEKKLTELKWKKASADWGQVRVGNNVEGGPLKINGKTVEYGIGTHAESIILFDLPAGFTKFQCRAGLDDGGVNQSNGAASSVKFLVFADANPRQLASLVQPKSGGGGNRGNVPPGEALDGLDVNEDLEVTLFAHEPMTLSPSNIDVDAMGRVWVCEVVNYRHFANKNNPAREAGDRILILEDTDGDAKADKQTVFYQGRDIDSAHGVCVLGNRAIVSALDSVFILTDTDGDWKADKKDLLFTGIAGAQHDHGIHSFLFGPDGKLYFNFGNAGKHLKDKDGKPIVDQAGNVVNDSRKPYQEGMVFRCNLDGSELETLGWNFRNNWELAVDSFGTIWQSDNDDDGNRGVRINYVMEFGNYGYKDEFTGAGWRSPRTGMHEEIPKRHWHLNDPGVVPNLLQTGAGSPTGICVYEGDLLPKRFFGDLIHCDAGPNIVRTYHLENDGAGYKAEIENILEGSRDQWFRPSDVCVAPDGSLIIADWYDPGVGGHRMGDIQKGRIFRIAPPKSDGYKTPKFDFKTAEGAVEALKSPNLAVRYLAWTALHDMGENAESALLKLYNDKDHPRLRARALWLLGKIKGKGHEYAWKAAKDDDPNIRIVGLRLARQVDPERELLHVLILGLAKDESPQVRRECAIALRSLKLKNDVNRSYNARLWNALATKHEAGDRWNLEALGIGAENNWDACLEKYLELADSPRVTEKSRREIIWRSRATQTPSLLAEIILDPQTPAEELPRYFRALDLLQGLEVKEAVLSIAFADLQGDAGRKNFITTQAFERLKGVNIQNDPKAKAKLASVLDNSKGTEQFVELVGKFNVKDRYPELLAMAQAKPNEQLGVEAMRTLLAKNQTSLITKALNAEDPQTAEQTIQALGNAGDKQAEEMLWNLIEDTERPLALRRAAVTAAANSRNSAVKLAKLTTEGKLDDDLKDATASALHTAQWPDVKAQAAKLFPLPATKNNKPLPPIEELVKRQGDVKVGRVLFNTTATCNKCHIVNHVGREVGPDLSEIGKKLSREALYQSILFPSAGISHNYESYLIAFADGTTVTGLVPSRTEEEIAVKGVDGLTRTYKMADVEIIKKQNISLMPADLQKVMSEEDLINVVEYLTTLKEAKKLGQEGQATGGDAVNGKQGE